MIAQRWLWLLATHVSACLAATVNISNVAPRLDTNGQIVDAHDGSVQRFIGHDGYWMHAVQYGLCEEPAKYGCDQTSEHCGFRLDHNITVYVTPDLSSGSWKFVANALEIADRPAGTVFRPHAVYNPVTQQYVLWWNYVWPNGTYAGNAVALSDSPQGERCLRAGACVCARSRVRLRLRSCACARVCAYVSVSAYVFMSVCLRPFPCLRASASASACLCALLAALAPVELTMRVGETAGPFKLVNELVNVTRGHGGDFDLFVDTDGSGYVRPCLPHVVTTCCP
jgi:hypothetical protein